MAVAVFGHCAALFAAQPKLIVAILVDQLRYDYLERFQHQFSSNGFRVLTERGTFMTAAQYSYAPTVTGPGHASFLSGATPVMHGIIGNEWYDRRTRRDVYCVEDPSVDGVGATPGKARMSPKNFIGSNFADELRLRFKSKVIGISMKDRGAILPAGKKPTGAYWFHSANGNFVTSTYYRTDLPDWVKEFNKRKRAQSFVDKTWTRLLEAKEYAYPDDVNGEGNLADEKKPVFDHKVAPSKDGYENVVATPFGNQILAEFAEAAVEGENLGQGENPDLLCVSFSSVDYVGHRFGPYSQELQDAVLRLDRQLEGFFNYLDKKIGLDHIVMTLTADHGVAPTPEFARSQGLEADRFNDTDWLSDLKQKLAEEFGPGRYLESSKIYSGHLYLNHDVIERKKLTVDQVTSFIREAALASGKYQAVFTREQLLDGRAPGNVGRLVVNGYNGERGGDLVLVLKPFLFPGTGKTGTSHGSPYSYDTHVPVLFFGAEFKPGRYSDEFTISDIIPTLSAALGVTEPSGSMGRPCLKILREAELND
jgi:predicted AlkP superfamily pyrophosphatase or phosphodiesterase